MSPTSRANKEDRGDRGRGLEWRRSRNIRPNRARRKRTARGVGDCGLGVRLSSGMSDFEEGQEGVPGGGIY